MSAPIPIQETIGGVNHGDLNRQKIAAMDPDVAGSLANALRGGIIASKILKINPEDHPADVKSIQGKLGLLEARSRQ